MYIFPKIEIKIFKNGLQNTPQYGKLKITMEKYDQRLCDSSKFIAQIKLKHFVFGWCYSIVVENAHSPIDMAKCQ
jgi:hypothetical protein